MKNHHEVGHFKNRLMIGTAFTSFLHSDDRSVICCYDL